MQSLVEFQSFDFIKECSARDFLMARQILRMFL